jgi:hypothetical protein
MTQRESQCDRLGVASTWKLLKIADKLGDFVTDV